MGNFPPNPGFIAPDQIKEPEPDLEKREIKVSIAEAMKRMVPDDEVVAKKMAVAKPNYYGRRRESKEDEPSLTLKVDGDEWLSLFRQCIENPDIIDQYSDNFPKEFLDYTAKDLGVDEHMPLDLKTLEGKRELVRAFFGIRDHSHFVAQYKGFPGSLLEYFKEKIAPKFSQDQYELEAYGKNDPHWYSKVLHIRMPKLGTQEKNNRLFFAILALGKRVVRHQGFPTGDGSDMERFEEMQGLIDILRENLDFEELNIHPGDGIVIQPQFKK